MRFFFVTNYIQMLYTSTYLWKHFLWVYNKNIISDPFYNFILQSVKMRELYFNNKRIIANARENILCIISPHNVVSFISAGRWDKFYDVLLSRLSHHKHSMHPTLCIIFYSAPSFISYANKFYFDILVLQSKRVKVRASLGKIKWRKKCNQKAEKRTGLCNKAGFLKYTQKESSVLLISFRFWFWPKHFFFLSAENFFSASSFRHL